MKKKIAVVCGTRPEVIKLSPVVFSLSESATLEPVLIGTGQHGELADQMFRVFGLEPDFKLEIDRSSPATNLLASELLRELENIYKKISPDGVIVQGDTTSALCGALAAFHNKIPVAHVEAGLRTDNYLAPFPEEMNRVLISKLADTHFAPTLRAASRLKEEGAKGQITITGNTGIDALLWTRNKLKNGELIITAEVEQILKEPEPFILVTMHRRENHGAKLKAFITILRRIAGETSLNIVIPVHKNPTVQDVFHSELKYNAQIKLISSVDYPSMIALMEKCLWIISDSGGVQEEAPTIGRYVFVTREVTERPELFEFGFGEILPLDDIEKAVARIHEFIKSTKRTTGLASSPFGDGKAAEKITKVLEARWQRE